MDPRQQLAADRAEAVRRITALRREHDGIIEASGQSNADDEHDPEGATIAFERQHLAALLEQARSRLGAIDAAIARLDAGTYGRCEGCAEPIGTERLSAQPAATCCVRCAGSRR